MRTGILHSLPTTKRQHGGKQTTRWGGGGRLIIIPCSRLWLYHTKDSTAITSANLDNKAERQTGILSPFHIGKLRHTEVK